MYIHILWYIKIYKESKASKGSNKKLRTEGASDTSESGGSGSNAWQHIHLRTAEVEFLSAALEDMSLLDKPEWMNEAKVFIEQTSISVDIWKQGITIHKCNIMDSATPMDVLKALRLAEDLSAETEERTALEEEALAT